MDNQSLAEVQEGPSGHLNTSWEIALVAVFIIVILVILGTVWFQIRRRKRRHQRMSPDAELGARSESCSHSSREERKDVYSEVTMPDRIADIPRHPRCTRSMASSPISDSSCDKSEQPLNKHRAPRYYWDSRR